MLTNFLSLMIDFLRSMSDELFVIPLGFIILTICIYFFDKMGAR